MRDMTVRTVYGAVDMVPLLRRLDGDMSAPIPDWERDGGVVALTEMGYPTYAIMRVLGMSGAAVLDVLAKCGMEPHSAPEQIAWTGVAQTSSAQRRAKRLAERVEVDGRPFHPEAPHGTDLAYTDYGCHCGPCRAAHTAKLAQDRAKKKMRAAA